MAAVIEIEFHQGNNEQVIKEAAICADGAARIHYLFHPPYHMEPHGSKEWIELGRWVHSLQSGSNSTD